MALREFEPIPAVYYPKITDSTKYSEEGVNFMCSAFSPKEISVVKPIHGFIANGTKWVISTTNKEINFKNRGLVEIFGDKLRIVGYTEDSTDTNMLGASKFKSDVIKADLPKWMTLE